MDEIEFTLPDENEPGFLRRQRDFMALPFGNVDALVNFLMPYVKVPEDSNAAREALLDMTKSQLDEVSKVLLGMRASAVLPKSSGKSASGSPATKKGRAK